MACHTVIKRVVNALATQHRVILHLECGHNHGVNELRFLHEPTLQFSEGDAYTCPYCPDPPTTVAEPSPRDEFDALFKEGL
jgi:hypothetical protein